MKVLSLPKQIRLKSPLVGGAILLLLSLRLTAAEDSAVFHSQCSEGAAGEIRSPELRVVTLNISHGRGLAVNQLLVSKGRTQSNVEAIADLLVEFQADVVGFQEADGPSRWSGNFDHVEAIARRADYACSAHGLHSRSFLSDARRC